MSGTAQFEDWARKLSRAELGGLLKEYVAESNHGGWEGFSRQDMTGIRKFLADLQVYYENAQPDDFAGKFSSTNPVI
jgi:hypothetical protein